MDNDLLKNKQEREHLRGQAAINKKNREIAKEEQLKQKAISENNKMQATIIVKKQLSKVANVSNIKLSKRHEKILLNFSVRKDIAQIYANYTKQQSINYKQTFTSRYKSINYSGNSKGINSLSALKTSLNHSSRKQKRSIEEWLESESHMNIYYADDVYYSHTEFLTKRDEILSFYDDLKETVNDYDDQEHKKALAKASKNRNSYAAKLKKLLPMDHDDNNNLIKIFSQWECEKHKSTDLNRSKNKIITCKVRVSVKNKLLKMKLSDKHIETKLRVFDNYLLHRAEHQKLKNSIKDRKVTNKNSTLINESVFKIPHSMGDLSHLPKKELLEAGISFFKQKFPENIIKLGCLHADEGLCTDIQSGLNFHIFTSRSSNCAITWREQYINFAKSFALDNPEIFPELLEINLKNKLPAKTMVLVGQCWQLSFFQHLQNEYFNKHKISLRFLESEERADFNVIQAMCQEHLPLADRAQSRFNMLNDKSTRLLKDNNIAKGLLNDLNQKIEIKEKSFSDLLDEEKTKIEPILMAIDLWKVNPEHGNLAVNYIHTLNNYPDIQQALLAEITDYERENNLSKNNMISPKIGNYLKPK
jgi:hypothetical protein